ncbi:hypothetical protein EKD04_025180 [Chloroflexales bacterium ZM16-3]|nr:hypothetical protein [Chloroflexales bacterium ZM16-3]
MSTSDSGNGNGKKKPAPQPQPVVVADATLRRLIAQGGRIEAPKGPTKAA